MNPNSMKVKDLIEELQKINPDLKVLIYPTPRGDEHEALRLKVRYVRIAEGNRYFGGNYITCKPEQATAVTVRIE